MSIQYVNTPERKDSWLQVRVSRSYKEHLKSEAEKRGMTLSQYVLTAVDAFECRNGVNAGVNTDAEDVNTLRSGTRKLISFLNEVKNTWFATERKFGRFIEVLERHLSMEELAELEVLIKE